jgi:hypothetical protein
LRQHPNEPTDGELAILIGSIPQVTLNLKCMLNAVPALCPHFPLQVEDVAGSFLVNVLPYLEIVKDGAPPLPSHCRGPSRWDNPRRANRVVSEISLSAMLAGESHVGGLAASLSSAMPGHGSGGTPWSISPWPSTTYSQSAREPAAASTETSDLSTPTPSLPHTDPDTADAVVRALQTKHTSSSRGPASVSTRSPVLLRVAQDDHLLTRTSGAQAAGEAQLVVVDKAYIK